MHAQYFVTFLCHFFKCNVEFHIWTTWFPERWLTGLGLLLMSTNLVVVEIVIYYSAQMTYCGLLSFMWSKAPRLDTQFYFHLKRSFFFLCPQSQHVVFRFQNKLRKKKTIIAKRRHQFTLYRGVLVVESPS